MTRLIAVHDSHPRPTPVEPLYTDEALANAATGLCRKTCGMSFNKHTTFFQGQSMECSNRQYRWPLARQDEYRLCQDAQVFQRGTIRQAYRQCFRAGVKL